MGPRSEQGAAVAEAATLAGLSAAEVDQRRRAGPVNVVARRSSRGAWSIVRSNVLTRFNAILGVLYPRRTLIVRRPALSAPGSGDEPS